MNASRVLLVPIALVCCAVGCARITPVDWGHFVKLEIKRQNKGPCTFSLCVGGAGKMCDSKTGESYIVTPLSVDEDNATADVKIVCLKKNAVGCEVPQKIARCRLGLNQEKTVTKGSITVKLLDIEDRNAGAIKP